MSPNEPTLTWRTENLHRHKNTIITKIIVKMVVVLVEIQKQTEFRVKFILKLVISFRKLVTKKCVHFSAESSIHLFLIRIVAAAGVHPSSRQVRRRNPPRTTHQSVTGHTHPSLRPKANLESPIILMCMCMCQQAGRQARACTS